MMWFHMRTRDEQEDAELLCHRCGSEQTPGEGSFYVVKIKAFADPSPPRISAQNLKADLEGEMNRLIEQMRHLPEQELMDQVYRQLTILLCGPCYRVWIENPAG